MQKISKRDAGYHDKESESIGVSDLWSDAHGEPILGWYTRCGPDAYRRNPGRTGIVRKRSAGRRATLASYGADQVPVMWRMASWKLRPSTRMKKSMALPARSRSGQRQ